MEEYNFESELQRKLNERVIAPSENAWDRVNLNRKKKKKSRMPGWYWLAAILVIGLGFYLSQIQPGGEVANDVVSSEKKSPGPAAPQIRIAVNLPAPVASTAAREKFSCPSEIMVKHIAIDTPKEIIPEINVAQAPIKDLEGQKANEILADLEKLQQSGAEITEKMLDDLIRQSQMEIAAERLAAIGPKTDPTILLADVERDMDRSFKERVFDLLRGKGGKIKIAFRESNP
jgi:hypothetical protein